MPTCTHSIDASASDAPARVAERDGGGMRGTAVADIRLSQARASVHFHAAMPNIPFVVAQQ
jgi:hypothetical protein